MLRRRDGGTRLNKSVSLVKLKLMLSLNASTNSAIGDIGNAVGDYSGLVDERDIGEHGDDPANTVEILREEHTGNDAVIALSVLDLERIL